MNCLNCNSLTDNPKFCNRSCSASYNNKIPKRKILIINLCKCCNKKLSRYKGSRKTNLCKICQYNEKILSYGNKILKDCINESLSKSSRHRYELVRQHAKRIAKIYNLNKSCVCGYSKHTELCHIKPISSFKEDNKINEINAKNNLIYLCPNCHWELDNKG